MDTDHTRTQVTLKSQKSAFGLERDCLCHNALSNTFNQYGLKESAVQVGEGLATDNLPCLSSNLTRAH